MERGGRRGRGRGRRMGETEELEEIIQISERNCADHIKIIMF